MPERIDHVQIALSRETIELPWDSRTWLLDQIRHLDSARSTVEAFEAVGTSRPVTLPQEANGIIVHAIDVWSKTLTVDGLPPGVWDLRNALHDDLHDSQQ